MDKPQSARWITCVLAVSGLLISAPALAAAASNDAVPACGGDKGGKDTKKPKPDDDQTKRPTNPA